jgi:hypothetical protein
MKTMTSKRRHKRARKRAKWRQIRKVAVRMESRILSGAIRTRDELLAALIGSSKGRQKIAEAGAEYIRSRLGLPVLESGDE